MDSKTYLSKQEIADLSDVTIGKVKYYIGLFKDYFPEVFIDGNRHPVYESNAVDVVKIIASMIRDSNHNDIRRALSEAGHNQVINFVPEGSTANTTAKHDDNRSITNQQFLSMQSIVDTLDAQKQIIDIQAETIRQQKQIIDDLRQRLNLSSIEE